MKIVTDRIAPEEPCYGLVERPRLVNMADGSRQSRWLQAVYVLRGDAIAEYTTDFGPAVKFAHVTPLIMPSDGTDSVAELLYYADENRHDDYWFRRKQEIREASTLIEDAVRQTEQQHELIRNRSQIGPGGIFQRNGFPQQQVERDLMDRVHSYHGTGPWMRGGSQR